MDILKTDALTKMYGKQKANDAVSVTIKQGDICGFVGRNGSGKTTFIRLITGLIKTSSGGFEFGTEGRKPRMGAVVESPSFFGNLTAEENIIYQAKLTGADIESSLECLKTVGLDVNNRKKVKNYSLGMKQRLGIALAMVSDPEILILDEPTNGMDPAGIIEMRDFLKELAEKKNITIIVSSHILSELSLLATSFVFLDSGKVIERITREEMNEKLKKKLILKFYEESVPDNVFEECVEKGLAESFTKTAPNECVIVSPSKYSEIFKILGDFSVCDMSTSSETLETYYMNMIGGAVNE